MKRADCVIAAAFRCTSAMTVNRPVLGCDIALAADRIATAVLCDR